MALTPKQKIFADEYLIDLNATRAYKVAYPNCKKDEAAAVNGSKLLRNAKVAAYVQERMLDREKRTEITQDMIVRELAAIAFSKATDYVAVESNGPVAVVCVKPTSELDEYQIRAIAGIKEGANGVEIKLNDKEKALELLGRHLGMWNDKLQVSGLDDEKSKLDDLIKQMRGGD